MDTARPEASIRPRQIATRFTPGLMRRITRARIAHFASNHKLL